MGPATEAEKRAAAEAAALLVQDGMSVGLGTGSTVAYLIPALAERSLSIRCVATSPETERVARSLGLSVEAFEELDHLDLAIDGADQFDPDGWLVKGGGGAHTREKVVAVSAERFVFAVPFLPAASGKTHIAATIRMATIITKVEKSWRTGDLLQ